MSEDNGQGMSRRKLLRSGALIGGLAAASASIPLTSNATTTPRLTAPRSTTLGSRDVPNKYGKPFSVADDELFIFAASYKPLEFGATAERQATRFFDTVLGDALRARFPDQKIKYATWDFPIRYEDLQAAGVVPDIIIDDPRTRIDRDLEWRGWVQDMTAMVSGAGIDLGALNQGSVELVKSRSDGGLYGVPLFIDEHLLFYNKKIFDKFKVRYPKVGMTYDEAYLLAKRLTGQVGLDAYKGYMQHPDNYLALNQAGLYPFLPTTGEEPAPADVKVNITSKEWVALTENLYRFLFIPRNNFTTVDDFVKGDMSRPGHVAMAVNTLSKLNAYSLNEMYIEDDDVEEMREWVKSVDIGVTSIPVLEAGSTTIYQPNARAAYITPQSQKTAQAVEVVKWLVSEEAQVRMSEYGMKGVLQTDAVVQAFGRQAPQLQGIDTSAVYWGENALVKNYQNTEYWDIPLYSVFRQHVIKDGMDVLSSLTVAEQLDIPAYIKAQAAAGKYW
jgi:multiple sugar transport system substrate-binding protein